MNPESILSVVSTMAPALNGKTKRREEVSDEAGLASDAKLMERLLQSMY